MNASLVYGRDLPVVGSHIKQGFENGQFFHDWLVFTYLKGEETIVAQGRTEGWSRRAAAQIANEIAFAKDAELRAAEKAGL